jgi:hypothetical protein
MWFWSFDMAVFPKLTTGAVTQYPCGRRSSYSTFVTRFVDGAEQRFRELKAPVRRWVIQLSQLSAYEIGAIEELFVAEQGQFGSFTFVDPWDGVEYPNCSFDGDIFSTIASSESNSDIHLVIRNNNL